MFLVLTLYNKIDVDNSEIMVTHERIAPDTMPDIIMGTVILKKVFNLLDPKLSAASSIDGEICC